MQNTNPGFSGFMGNFMPGASNDRPPPPPAQTQVNRGQNERTAAPTNRPDLMRARNNDGINIQEQFGRVDQQQKESTERSTRPEMKGPTDISDLLSGLKTMSINLPTENNKSLKSSPPPVPEKSVPLNKPDMIKKSASTGKTPRKQKSDKNTVSLDI
jgi:hypothetical protein